MVGGAWAWGWLTEHDIGYPKDSSALSLAILSPTRIRSIEQLSSVASKLEVLGLIVSYGNV